MNIGWHHSKYESDRWDGFNVSGIEHFRGNPLLHLAREVIQNAIDARDDKKIKVRFKMQEVETSTIPNLDELQNNMNQCLTAAENESEKAKLFFTNAIAKLNGKKITILEVSDFNTHGMKGPSKNGTPFYAFIKAEGQSKKDSETASGSYGIGKYAPYATSELRTIFVSTIYKDDEGEYHQLTQGKSLLMSHDVGEERKEGIGYWGKKDKCQPVEDFLTLPEWILRAANKSDYSSFKGTKISILCFNNIANWQDYLAISAAENYFAAISDDRLEINVDDIYALNSKNLEDFFADSKRQKLVCDSNLSNEPEQFNNAFQYYLALQSRSDIIVEHKEHKHLGLCQLRIRVGEGLPKKVCALRNGMFISDYINRLKLFPDFKEFVAVFQCESEKGNKLLRLMEPPRHDDFEPNLLPTREEQKKGKKSLKDIADWIREMLKAHAKDPVSEVTPLDELKDYFGEEGGEGAGDGTEEINPFGKLIFRAKPIKYNAQLEHSNGDGDKGNNESGGGGGGKNGAGGGDGIGGKGIADGGSGGGGKSNDQIALSNVRAIVTGSRKRQISATPTKSSKISVCILEAGADIDYNTAIINTDIGQLKNGSVIINAVEGKRITLNIELDADYNGALKVVANEI